MKILLVSPFTSQSGSAIRFWNIALQFKARGYAVVYSDRGSRSGRPLYHADGIVYQPGRIIGPLYIDIVLSTVYNLFIFLRHHDCHVFYALKPAPNNCIPALVARMLGKKTILDIDDLDYEYLPRGIKQSISRFFFHLFPRFFPLVTCHTRNLLDFCSKNLNLPDSRLYFLAQGVSSEFLGMKVAESTRRASALLYVATLGITSDFDDLVPMFVKVFAAYPEATLTVVGDGVRRARFEALVAERGIRGNVTFVGQVDHADLPGLMETHAIGINYMRPSRVNNCRAILKIREYLACGLHVVCNNTGDAIEFKDVAFVEQDIASMEKRILELLSRPVSRNTAGMAFVETNYAWSAIFDAFMKLLANHRVIPHEVLSGAYRR